MLFELRSTAQYAIPCYATLLMKNDFNLKANSKILGHAKEIVTADIYVDKRYSTIVMLI